jgi:hypothetical protein
MVLIERNSKKFFTEDRKVHEDFLQQKLAKEAKVRLCYLLSAIGYALRPAIGYALRPGYSRSAALVRTMTTAIGTEKDGFSNRDVYFPLIFWAGVSIAHTRHSQFIKSDAPAALCNH